VHPLDGSLYVALTNNLTHGNFYGQLVRLIEDRDDPEGTTFRFEVFLAGGPQCGLACPDNLIFDRKGNLWVATDISGAKLNKPPYASFANNGMFLVPTSGPAAGDAYQFASGPVECELTGPWFTENGDTLFLSVQHPGERSARYDAPTSRWPNGGDDEPRSSVVAITGFPA
jgi:secreted PhoX family phosphatase